MEYTYSCTRHDVPGTSYIYSSITQAPHSVRFASRICAYYAHCSPSAQKDFAGGTGSILSHPHPRTYSLHQGHPPTKPPTGALRLMSYRKSYETHNRSPKGNRTRNFHSAPCRLQSYLASARTRTEGDIEQRQIRRGKSYRQTAWKQAQELQWRSQ